MLAFIITTRGHFVNLLHINNGTDSPKMRQDIVRYIDKKPLRISS